MTWKLWHSVATFSFGFALVVGCGSNDEETNPYQPCGNGGTSAASTTATTTTSMQDAVTTVGQQSVGVGPSSSVAQSTAVASSVASSVASGGGSCSAATCNGANCCCTFNGTTLCIGSSMCVMGGGKCN